MDGLPPGFTNDDRPYYTNICGMMGLGIAPMPSSLKTCTFCGEEHWIRSRDVWCQRCRDFKFDACIACAKVKYIPKTKSLCLECSDVPLCKTCKVRPCDTTSKGKGCIVCKAKRIGRKRKGKKKKYK